MNYISGIEYLTQLKLSKTMHLKSVILAAIILTSATSAHASEFLSYVKSGDLEQVKSAIAAGENVNAADASKGTPLHIAAKNGQDEIAELLLDSGANISAQLGKSQKTALHLAAQEGHITLITLLLERGADIEMKDKKGETPIFAAILKNRFNAVALLIDNKADLNVVSRFKDTPAYKAIALGKPEITDLLLEHGASLDLNRVVEKKCSKCHGMNGRSQAPFSPNLASMGQQYLVQQFKDYRSGTRNHQRMDKKLTTGISNQVLDKLSGYYASMPAVELQSDPDVIARGKRLYEMRNSESNSCMGCHGDAGLSSDTSQPRLAGQNAEYIAIQLRAYRDGERSNDAEAVMRNVSKALSEQQIVDIAGYVQSL